MVKGNEKGSFKTLKVLKEPSLVTPTGFEAELRTRKNVGIIGDFAIFNEEIMKKNKAFFILLFSNFSVKKGVKIQTCQPPQVALAPLHIIPD